MKKFNSKWLYNKTVVITGASGGLGFSLAKYLINKFDCKIIGVARNKEKMEKMIPALGEKQSNFSYYLFDVSVKENWQKFKDDLCKDGVKIDVLINNAGFMLPFKKFEDISTEEIDEIIATNFISDVYAVKQLLPLLKQSETPAIINISSVVGVFPLCGESMYCATKFAIKGFTECLYTDYKKQIYVGGVYPGFMKTDILKRTATSEKTKRLLDKLMMPPEKAAKKICKGMKKRKYRMIIGLDAEFMNFCAKFFPKTSPLFIKKILKISNVDIFNQLFKD